MLQIYYPENVKYILTALENHGFEAYVVGGCVRDSLLGINVNDWDITTSAEPAETIECFNMHKLILTGIKHGTVGVIISGTVYEITSFRHDGEYLDNRHPQNVTFTKSLAEDLKRRDFTINALAYSHKSGLIDLFGGRDDLSQRIIKCVGEPEKRFTEDALRIIRALRFSASLGFKIESDTADAMLRNKRLLCNVSVERIASEFNKILCSDTPSKTIQKYKEIFFVFIPELSEMLGFEQHTPHHDKDVWQHTLCALDNVQNSLVERLAMLFHDISKPLMLKIDADGVGHFHGHALLSESISRNILRRMHYPNSVINDVADIIRYHESLRKIDAVGLKKIINLIGVSNTDKLLDVNLADILAQSSYQHEEKLNDCAQKRKIFTQIIQNNECTSLKQLKLNGENLINIGITDGKTIGHILTELLNAVIEGKVENNKEKLFDFVSKNFVY